MDILFYKQNILTFWQIYIYLLVCSYLPTSAKSPILKQGIKYEIFQEGGKIPRVIHGLSKSPSKNFRLNNLLLLKDVFCLAPDY